MAQSEFCCFNAVAYSQIHAPLSWLPFFTSLPFRVKQFPDTSHNGWPPSRSRDFAVATCSSGSCHKPYKPCIKWFTCVTQLECRTKRTTLLIPAGGSALCSATKRQALTFPYNVQEIGISPLSHMVSLSGTGLHLLWIPCGKSTHHSYPTSNDTKPRTFTSDVGLPQLPYNLNVQPGATCVNAFRSRERGGALTPACYGERCFMT